MAKHKYAVRFLFAFAVLLPITLTADEGWLTRARVGGGALYSKTEHPDIALEKEVLIYKGEGKVEAHFLFKNTSMGEVVVDVGFPVKILMPHFRSEHFYLSPGVQLLKKIYGFTDEPASDTAFQSFFKRIQDNSNSAELNIKRMMSWSAFLRMNKFWRDDLVHNLTILQNGSTVAIDSVFLVAKLAGKGTLTIDFHFLHRLNFQSNSYSTVVVSYASFSRVMNTGSGFFNDYFRWHYVLGTGRTWKGPIQKLYVLAPDHLQPHLPAVFLRVGDYKKKTIYMATQYEPVETDEIDCAYLKFGQVGSFMDIVLFGETQGKEEFSAVTKPIDEPKLPAQPIVRVKQASSFLPQRTWVNAFQTGPVPRSDPLLAGVFDFFSPEIDKLLLAKYEQIVVENFPATCKSIGFGPLSLFDGIPESAWCEGVNGPGIGEWVAFELTEDVEGLAIHNGFQKVRWCWCMTDDSQMREYDEERMKQFKAIYGNNNRVKTLEIVSEDGQFMKTIRLRDTPNRQSFKNISLPMGSYKLYIRDIYKGTKWDDTCLGEIEFFRANAKWLVEDDDFLRKVFR